MAAQYIALSLSKEYKTYGRKRKVKTFEIDHYFPQLQSKRIVTTEQLAEKHDVSLRTFYGDIRTLEKSGIPTVTEHQTFSPQNVTIKTCFEKYVKIKDTLDTSLSQSPIYICGSIYQKHLKKVFYLKSCWAVQIYFS